MNGQHGAHGGHDGHSSHRKAHRIDSLKHLKHMVEESHGGGAAEGQGYGDRHGAPTPEYAPSFLAGLNPIEAEYERPDSSQGMDYIPENVNKRMLPMYLPVSATDRMPGFDNKPVHSARLMTRSDFINTQILGESQKEGGLTATYKFYFWAWVFLALTIISALFINVYLAAIFAWLAGHNYSESETNTFWTKLWWTTKPLTHTT